MSRYLITGGSGSGKSAVGDELARRGYDVIESDTVIGSWINKDTGAPVRHNPPFTIDWLQNHDWVWDKDKFQLATQERQHDLFIIGGAANIKEFVRLFDGIFALVADGQSVKRRLQEREPARWADSRPELEQVLRWNSGANDYYKNLGATLLDGTQPVAKIADQILERLR